MFLKYLHTHVCTPGPFLVVAPLSTMQHWRREIEAFTDDLYAVVYHGSSEDRAVIRDREWEVRSAKNVMVEGATRFQVCEIKSIHSIILTRLNFLIRLWRSLRAGAHIQF